MTEGDGRYHAFDGTATGNALCARVPRFVVDIISFDVDVVESPT